MIVCEKHIDILGISPEIKLVIDIADDCMERSGFLESRITSLTRVNSNSSYHSPFFSLNRGGERLCYAVDFSTIEGDGNQPKKANKAVLMMRDRLPSYIDIIYGGKGHGAHIHIEVDIRKALKNRAERYKS